MSPLLNRQMQRPERVVRFLRLPLRAWLLTLCLAATSAPAQSATIAVLYPDVREPYYTVFMTLLRGIEAGAGGVVKRKAVPEDFDASILNRWLRDEKADVIIALGQRGLKAAKAARGDLPVVTGALLLTPGQVDGENVTGVSLAADPERLFGRLKSLAPAVKRIFVVYYPEVNGWLMKLATRAAGAYGLELHAYAAHDLRAAALRYKEILDKARDEADAVWLPLDSTTVDDDVVLPMILEAAWTQHLVVFSGNPAHAQRGVLFALYPDNLALGRRLADMALRAAKEGRHKSAAVFPLTDLHIAVNLRTATHLGLHFASGQQRDFDLVFPSP
jgi:ABC-type uncharacterized transport system substrate-binding protein